MGIQLVDFSQIDCPRKWWLICSPAIRAGIRMIVSCADRSLDHDRGVSGLNEVEPVWSLSSFTSVNFHLTVSNGKGHFGGRFRCLKSWQKTTADDKAATVRKLSTETTSETRFYTRLDMDFLEHRHSVHHLKHKINHPLGRTAVTSGHRSRFRLGLRVEACVPIAVFLRHRFWTYSRSWLVSESGSRQRISTLGSHVIPWHQWVLRLPLPTLLHDPH